VSNPEIDISEDLYQRSDSANEIIGQKTGLLEKYSLSFACMILILLLVCTNYIRYNETMNLTGFLIKASPDGTRTWLQPGTLYETNEKADSPDIHRRQLFSIALYLAEKNVADIDTSKEITISIGSLSHRCISALKKRPIAVSNAANGKGCYITVELPVDLESRITSIDSKNLLVINARVETKKVSVFHKILYKLQHIINPYLSK